MNGKIDSLVNSLGTSPLLAAKGERAAAALNGGSAGAKGSAPADAAKAMEAAKDFEALLVHQMMKSMWQTVPKGGMLTGSREEQYYQDMLSEALSNEIASGQGIGIKEVIEKELARKDKTSR